MNRLRIKLMLLALLFLPATLMAQSSYKYDEIDEFDYQIDIRNVYATVLSTSKEGDIEIPSSIEYEGITYPVKIIDTQFIHTNKKPNCKGGANYNKITSIAIPSSVTSIRDGAFGYSTTLKEIKLVDESDYFCIDDGVLYSKDKTKLIYYPCQKDASGFVIPDYVTTLGADAFSRNKTLTSIVIPATVTTLTDGGGSALYGYYGTFNECSNLTSITFERGENYTFIPRYFLNSCSSLLSIDIPETIISIHAYAFNGCSKLQNTTLPSKLEEIWECAFQGCSEFTEVIFPKTIKTLGNSAFNLCTKNKKLVIPDECPLTYISMTCFYNNYKLEDVYLSDNIKIIHQSAFNACQSLPSVDLPQNLEQIRDLAFYGCSKLKDVTFYDKLESIGKAAFANCFVLNPINLPSSLKTIGISAFYGAAIEQITIPASVTSVGACAFMRTSKLKEYIVESGNKNYTTIDGVLFTIDKKTLMGYPAASDRRVSYTVPAGVEVIEEGALSHNNLTHITLPSSLKTIWNGAFASNQKLTELTIPENVTSIGNRHTSSGSYTMATKNIIYGTKVKSLYMLNATTPPALGGVDNKLNVFPNASVNGNKGDIPTIYVKKSAYDNNVYQNHNLWKYASADKYAYEIPVTLPSSGLKTMGRDFDVDLSNSDFSAYAAVAISKEGEENVVSMEAVNVAGYAAGKYVPSRTGIEKIDEVDYETYTGVILKGDNGANGTYRIGEKPTSETIAQANYLVAATDATKVKMTETKNGTEYTNLGLKDGKFRFFTSDGTIAYNKCYLSMPASFFGSQPAGARTFSMRFIEPEVSGISAAETDMTADDDAYYTLQGVRIENPKHGIFIHKGKKVVIK